MALGLGSDVPFCLRGGRARVTGVGETIVPLAYQARRFMLLLPPLSVSTAAVYEAWDALNDEGETRELAGGNDLEAAAVAVVPRLGAWRDRLAQACTVRPRLAGSGSTWFVEGEASELGLEGREFLDLDGERAPLVAVQTLRPWSGAG
jgi:4-diphosphocytidyl-2-C-methyl-D-erythritol kinase